MKLSVVVLICLCLCACAQTITPQLKNFNTTFPGVVQTKQVGEALYDKGTVTVLPGFRIQRDADLPLMEHLLFPPLKRGDIWHCEKKLGNGDYLCHDPRLNPELIEADSTDKIPNNIPFFILTPAGQFQGLYFAWRGQVVVPESPVFDGLFAPAEALLGGSFKQELIYAGRSDDTIRFVYREFGADPATPTVVKGLNYNLATLEIVQLDDVIIEVLEATPTAIKYRIK